MNLTLRFEIRLMGLFGRIKRAYESVRAVHSDRCAEPVLVADYAEKAGLAVGTCRSTILQVGGSRDISQIAEDVVLSIGVPMVNVVYRPRAGHIEPCEPMLQVDPPVNANLSVTLGIDATGARSVCALSSAHKTSELAGFRVVVEKFAQALNRQFFHPFILPQPFRAQALI